jgi:cystathionine gamma-lyase
LSFDNIDVLEAACTPKTKLIWLESPTNPLLKTTDIRAVAALAKRKGILLVVDSTFMSPYLQRPLELGADIVVHSVTKYIAGHSDVLMGSVVTNSDDIVNKLRAIQNFCGAVPSPFECYLALRGLKTLHLRMDASTKNAQEIATFLESHPLVEKVLYPGLKSYPEYELAKSQTDGPGAMIALFTKGGLSVANKFLSELKLIGLAVSLGAVESLACSPALMTHTAVPLEARLAIGLTDNLIRLSVGIEHVDDLLLDLKQALDKALEFHKNGDEVKK